MKIPSTLLRQKRIWLKIFSIVAVVMVAVAVWPAVQWVIASCSARDQWCAEDCSQECYATRRVSYPERAGQVTIDVNSGLPFCTYPSGVRYEFYSCTRFDWCGGYATAIDQRLPSNPTEGQRCELYVAGTKSFTCCRVNNDPPPDPPGPCTPEYEEPTITLSSVNPPFPLTIGQDPESEGFDIVITVNGGEKTNTCDEGPDNAVITDISLESVSLSAASITWIEDELSLFYPGAAVLDSYPLAIYGDVNINEAIGILSFHVDPLDPGTYVIVVEATQDAEDNDVATETFNVKVYLLESTITMPGNEW